MDRWELFSERIPFEDISPLALIYEISVNNIRPEMDKVDWPFTLCEAIRKCWDVDAKKRPQIYDVKSKLSCELWNCQLHYYYVCFVG